MPKATKIGLRDLYFALLIDDPATGSPTYDTPTKVPGIISANRNPNASSETLFADDGPYDTAGTIGNVSLALNVADIPLETQAIWLGHTMSGGVMVRNKGDIPPWLAIGYRTLKSNGKYRWTWLLKGKFTEPEDNNESKSDKVNFQTPTINGNFCTLDCNGDWERTIDEDSPTYVAATGTNWFNSVMAGTADLSALTYTTSPADAASGVLRTAAVVWTFNKALNSATVNGSNFILLDASGNKVAGALTMNAGKTVITLTPTAQMAASTKHTAIVTDAVKDIWGCAPSVGVDGITFTTGT